MAIVKKISALVLGLSALMQVAAPAFAQGSKVTPGAPAGGKITNMTIVSDNVLDGQKLAITITGEGRVCNYYLTLTNTDTNQEWPLPKVSTFPAPDMIQMDLPNPNYPHGNYKFTAKARANDNRPGVSCEGGGNFISFKKTRLVVQAAAEAPKIVDVLTEPGKKLGVTNRYRNDEHLKFNVVGSVENSELKDAAKKCGWTAQMVDKNGVAKDIGKGPSFGVWQDVALNGIATGEYTLTVKTTSADDGLAKQPCLGKVTKKVEVFGAPGKINDFSIFAYGSSGGNVVGAQYAYLVLEPKISGATCMYKVTRKINHGKATVPTLHVHKPGASDKLPKEEYKDDKTYLDITVEGMGNNYFEGGSCEGSVNKTVTLRDDMQPLNK